jgi:uncharacterized membrane protein
VIVTKINIPRHIEGTDRVEAFSDGVMAIIMTLLIFELRVPTITDFSLSGAFAALLAIAPKFISFAVSFITIAIFWVNHHHFFSRITHTDWKLLWFNNMLLFWLTVVPFTTAFVGDYPTLPVAVFVYGLTLFFAALSFTLMGQYVFFKSKLLSETIPTSERRREWMRSWLGTGLYALASILAFVYAQAALFILAIIPMLFLVPNLLQELPDQGGWEN